MTLLEYWSVKLLQLMKVELDQIVLEQEEPEIMPIEWSSR